MTNDSLLALHYLPACSTRSRALPHSRTVWPVPSGDNRGFLLLNQTIYQLQSASTYFEDLPFLVISETYTTSTQPRQELEQTE